MKNLYRVIVGILDNYSEYDDTIVHIFKYKDRPYAILEETLIELDDKFYNEIMEDYGKTEEHVNEFKAAIADLERSVTQTEMLLLPVSVIALYQLPDEEWQNFLMDNGVYSSESFYSGVESTKIRFLKEAPLTEVMFTMGINSDVLEKYKDVIGEERSILFKLRRVYEPVPEISIFTNEERALAYAQNYHSDPTLLNQLYPKFPAIAQHCPNKLDKKYVDEYYLSDKFSRELNKKTYLTNFCSVDLLRQEKHKLNHSELISVLYRNPDIVLDDLLKFVFDESLSINDRQHAINTLLGQANHLVSVEDLRKLISMNTLPLVHFLPKVVNPEQVEVYLEALCKVNMHLNFHHMLIPYLSNPVVINCIKSSNDDVKSNYINLVLAGTPNPQLRNLILGLLNS